MEAVATAVTAARWLRELADLDLAETGVCCAAIVDFRGDLDFREPRTAAVAMMKFLVRDSDRRPFNNRPNHSNRSPYFPQDGFPNNSPQAEYRGPFSAAGKAVFREKRYPKNVFAMPEILGNFGFLPGFHGGLRRFERGGTARPLAKNRGGSACFHGGDSLQPGCPKNVQKTSETFSSFGRIGRRGRFHGPSRSATWIVRVGGPRVASGVGRRRRRRPAGRDDASHVLATFSTVWRTNCPAHGP